MKYQILIICLALLLLIPNIMAISEKINIKDYEITYSYNTEDANEGERFTLTVSIKNNGEARDNLEFTIDSNSPFDLEDEKWEIGNISSGETKTQNFRVDLDEDTAAGKYRLDFNIQDNKIDEEDNFDIEVESNKPELIIGEVQSSPIWISPDDKNIKLTIAIENTGGADATFTRTKLILPSGFTPSGSYSDSVNLGTIASKGNKQAVFYIDSDKNLGSGIKKAQIQIEYKDKNDDKISTLEFDIPVKSKPLFEITDVKTTPDKLVIGSKGKIRITIENIGEEEGKETIIRIFENSDYPFTFDEKTNYIGTLKPGETGTGIFNVEIDKSGNPNNYLLKVQIRTVSNNNVLVDEKTIDVNVSDNANSGMSPVFIAVLVVLILLVIILIYFINKARKRKI